jgi:adenylylsulfate kinase
MEIKRKILFIGLPSAGKTTLARLLVQRLNAVLFNADEVGTNVNKNLGFEEGDRVEHARRMGWHGTVTDTVGVFWPDG